MKKEIEIENWKTVSTKEYHVKQYKIPKRSTVHFERFLAKCGLLKQAERILDVGCGGGAVDLYLALKHEGININGIDIVDDFFYLFYENTPENVKKRVFLEKKDFLNLNEDYYKDSFDGIISLQTLSFMEHWKAPLEKMIALNPKYIAFSSLFYDGKLEYQIKIRDYEELGVTQDFTEKYYNIYSIPLVKEFLKQRGFTDFRCEPFEIDVDIEKPNHKNVGTYTMKLKDGYRLQISGAMLMPWYFIYASREY